MKFTHFFRRSFVFGACLLSLLLPRAHASLLSPGYETQLEPWLGQGNLNFTNIFTLEPRRFGVTAGVKF